MAFTSGEATDYKNLLVVMVDFAVEQGWVIMEQSADRVWLKGEGDSGLDEIYVGVSTYENPGASIYNWGLYGAWGYRAGNGLAQPKASALYGTWLYLWNSPIQYWISVDAKRILLVAKVGLVYETMYLGLMRPCATDAQIPYPLFIGGMGYTKEQSRTSTSTYHGAFWSLASAPSSQAGRYFTPWGAWGTFYTSGGGSIGTPYSQPLTPCGTATAVMWPGLDGTYMLEPIYIGAASETMHVFGEIEGVFRVSGYQNTAENILNVSGVSYLVVPNAFRSGTDDFCAIRMT